MILFAAAGAIAGDNVSYWIGRKVGHRFVDRFFKGERRKQVDWAHRQVEERGGYLIIIGRFIPGGRTVVTLSCGMLEMPLASLLRLRRRRRARLGDVRGPARLPGRHDVRGAIRSRASCSRSSVALAVAGVIEGYRWYRRRRAVADG